MKSLKIDIAFDIIIIKPIYMILIVLLISRTKYQSLFFIMYRFTLLLTSKYIQKSDIFNGI